MGPCRLCNKDRELRESHFMPAALYPKRKTILYATREASGIAPTEVRDYLLCGECEERFNKHGESEVLRLLAPKITRKRLPLFAQLDNAKPLRTRDGIAIYSGPGVGIDTCKFAYFALSLAWRGSVHEWTLPDGTRSSPYDLGPHDEPIRRFLLQEGPFPPETAVVMTFCKDEGSRDIWIAPGHGDRPDYGCSLIRMQMLGVILIVWLGATIPDHIKQLCCYSSPEKPFLAADCADVTAYMLGGLAPMPAVPERQKRD